VALKKALRWLCVPLALGLGACASGPAPLTLQQPLSLLGEVHDNAAGHRLRLQAFDALLATGARPALVMEMFDRGDQPVIDAARARQPRPTAAALVAEVLAARPTGAPTGGGWSWSFYEPFIERALQLDLPLVAANVGRAEARLVMRDGLAAHGFDPAVPEPVLAALGAGIEASHCGQVDAPMARRMALAQVARDQQMARALEAQAARGAVLLAGNGHVRTDLGAPRWLGPAARARAESIGVVESGDGSAVYDRRVEVAAQPRPDPCAGMPTRRP
jgi:uncharacterized iron-regulated protein